MIGVSVDCEYGSYTVGLSVTVGGILRLAMWDGHHHGVMVVKHGCHRYVVFTEGMWFSRRVCSFTEGLWFSQRACGFHRGSAVFTEGLWCSRRVCGFTEGLWFSQRVCGFHRGSVVSQRVCGFHRTMMIGERRVNYFGSNNNLWKYATAVAVSS